MLKESTYYDYVIIIGSSQNSKLSMKNLFSSNIYEIFSLLSKNGDDLVKNSMNINSVLRQGLDLGLEDWTIPKRSEDSVPLLALKVLDGSSEFFLISHLLVKERR